MVREIKLIQIQMYTIFIVLLIFLKFDFIQYQHDCHISSNFIFDGVEMTHKL